MENDFLNKETKLAKDMNVEDYNSIDSFGTNLLYRMGWKDNTAIGKDPKNGLVKPIVLIPRQKGLGLGAVQLPKDKSKYGKNINEKPKKNYFGTKVKIIEGMHKGLKGIIIENIEDDLELYLKNNEFINVQLDINNHCDEVCGLVSHYLWI